MVIIQYCLAHPTSLTYFFNCEFLIEVARFAGWQEYSSFCDDYLPIIPCPLFDFLIGFSELIKTSKQAIYTDLWLQHPSYFELIPKLHP